jgi:hypothetical protein
MFDAMKPQYPVGEYTLSRRQALVAIAALPTVLLSVVYQRQQSTIVVGEFLSRCAASIVACWHLINGRELGAVEQVLPQYVPTLMTLAQQPSPHQPSAARLVAQADDLQGILALHRNNLIAMEYYYREGVTYSRLAGDRNLYVYALHTTSWFSVSGDPSVVPSALHMPFEQASAARLPGVIATGGRLGTRAGHRENTLAEFSQML